MSFFKSRVSIYTSVTAIAVCAIAAPATAQEAKPITAWKPAAPSMKATWSPPAWHADVTV
jgi:hypothetical protein